MRCGARARKPRTHKEHKKDIFTCDGMATSLQETFGVPIYEEQERLQEERGERQADTKSTNGQSEDIIERLQRLETQEPIEGDAESWTQSSGGGA